MPGKNGTGPPRGAGGPKNGRGRGKGRGGGGGTGRKTGGRKGPCK